jgi:uncharacterized membrane protein
MQRNVRPFPLVAALLMLCAAASYAAGAGVADNAHLFKPETVTAADQIIQQIQSQQKHDVLVETYSAIPDDLKGQYSPDRKAQFFGQWAEQIGKQNSITGIVILICMNPGHVEVALGNKTRQRAFTSRDKDDVVAQLASAFKGKNYDAGILDALRTIQSRMASNLGSGGAAANSTSNSGGGYTGGGYATTPTPTPTPTSSTHGFHLGGLFCLAIGVIAIIMLFSAIARRNRGYGTPPQGGYPPGYMGQSGYPPSGSGGGGFGRGLLGGLLGGALGAWGYDRMTHGGQASGGYVPPPASSGGTNDVDTGYSSSGSDFGSSTPDSTGGDFGSSDAGGGGGDFGGGGGDSGGGDFGGGGGGDSGGGGDF